MNKLTPIFINGTEYFNTEELAIFKPDYFSECSNNVRLIVILKDISCDSYVYARNKGDYWILSSPTSSRSRTLLTREFCEKNIFTEAECEKYMNKVEKIPEEIELEKLNTPTKRRYERLSKRESNELAKRLFQEPYHEHMAKPTDHPSAVIPVDEKEISVEKEEEITNLINSNQLPPIVELSDNEKFKNHEGQVLNIMVRGMRNSKKIFFKGSDVESAFGLKGLVTEMKKKYELDIDYRFFNGQSDEKEKEKEKNVLYLTFTGLVRVLMSKKSNQNVETFQNWLNDVLFASKMGTNEQQNKLISNIKDKSMDSINELFSKYAKTIPCVYLCGLNTVGKLRKELNIPEKFGDNDVVYKFGLTKTFNDTKYSDISKYDKIQNLIDLKLIMFTYVDPLYMSEAEDIMKKDMEPFKFPYDGHEDILVVPNEIIRSLKDVFENIGVKYSGHISELHKIINRYDHELDNLRKEIFIREELYKRSLQFKELEFKLSRAGINLDDDDDMSSMNFGNFGNSESDNDTYVDPQYKQLIQINDVKYILDDNKIYHIVKGHKGKLYGHYNPETNKVKKVKSSEKKSEKTNEESISDIIAKATAIAAEAAKTASKASTNVSSKTSSSAPKTKTNTRTTSAATKAKGSKTTTKTTKTKDKQ